MESESSQSDAVIEDIEIRIDGMKNLFADVQYSRLVEFTASRCHEIAGRIAYADIADTARLQRLREELGFYARWSNLIVEYLEWLRGLRDTNDTNEQEPSRETKANHFLP